MQQFDDSINQGRKGIAYEWQSLYAEAQAATLDRQLAAFAPQFAD